MRKVRVAAGFFLLCLVAVRLTLLLFANISVQSTEGLVWCIILLAYVLILGGDYGSTRS